MHSLDINNSFHPVRSRSRSIFDPHKLILIFYFDLALLLDYLSREAIAASNGIHIINQISNKIPETSIEIPIMILI